ncbi:MAG TPA: NAD(P)-dependent oxidoreductase [Pyrinomonadaceae bacterium]|jgi:nucleoside-diphosphate-sugar epimerase
MKRVLLTGATGFIGRHCVPPLQARGFEIHAVSSNVRDDERALSGIHWKRANLLSRDEVAELMASVQPTHLLHFAWEVTPGKFWASVENLRWVQASLDLLQEFASAGGSRVVMAGTCAEYDWRYGYCSEHLTPLAPRTLYGVCKHSLQMMVAAVAEQLNVSTAWGRVFFLYGTHESPQRLVPQVIRGLLQRERVGCTEGHQLRDFLYVEDVADAFVALLDSETEGAVNIASGKPVAVREIVTRIAEQLGGRELVAFGALPTPEDEPPLLVADTTRLNAEVGWKPAYNLDKGLTRTIEWWKSNH